MGHEKRISKKNRKYFVLSNDNMTYQNQCNIVNIDYLKINHKKLRTKTFK